METTGFDIRRDEVIDFAAGLAHVDSDGKIVGLGPGGCKLRDPGFPIPPEITTLTGITDADVTGKHLDIDAVGAFLDRADVLISHNASFDAPFVEALIPAAKGKKWACSCRDFPWHQFGFDGAKLGHLLMQAGWFMQGAHRAKADVLALTQLLSHRLPDGSTVIGKILKRAARTTWRVEATGAPFESRHVLRSRGYRWDRANAVWWIEADDDLRDAEIQWLMAEALPQWRTPEARQITWFTRHR